METLAYKINPEQIPVFQSAGKRFAEAKRTYQESPSHEFFTTLPQEGWYTLTDERYNELEALAAQMYHSTRDVYAGDANGDTYGNMNANYESLVQHIRVMQGLAGEYWQHGLAEFFPPGTTLAYVNALCLTHDWSRFAGINGSLPLPYVDQVSDAQLSQFFPGLASKEHLHGMDMIIDQDQHRNHDVSKVQSIMKLFDTCGKPQPRNPETFFVEGGEHDQWIDAQVRKGSLPFLALNPHRSWDSKKKTWDAKEERFISVDAAHYSTADKTLTMEGFRLVQESFLLKGRGIDFNMALARVTEKVTNDTSLVENFGKTTTTIPSPDESLNTYTTESQIEPEA